MKETCVALLNRTRVSVTFPETIVNSSFFIATKTRRSRRAKKNETKRNETYTLLSDRNRATHGRQTSGTRVRRNPS